MNIDKTTLFDKWFRKLKDNQAKIRIGLRLKKIAQGNFGDHKQLDQNLSELRFSLAQVIVFTTPLKTAKLFCYLMVVTKTVKALILPRLNN